MTLSFGEFAAQISWDRSKAFVVLYTFFLGLTIVLGGRINSGNPAWKA